MTATNLTPLILSGGSGTRLWPLSVADRPKQLQPLVEEARTMVQVTALRFDDSMGATAPTVVCNVAQADEIDSQLAGVDRRPDLVVVEPVARNTAPAVAAAALLADPETVLVAVPADHLIADSSAFRSAVAMAAEAAAAGSLVTFGIVPTHAHTGYGYIEVGEADDAGPRAMKRFVEKPDAAKALEYVDAGRFLWNSGIFVFTAATILDELHRHAPEVLSAVEAAVEESAAVDRHRTLGPSFAGALSISLDHAVMERTERAVVVPLDAGWSDVGSWHSLWEAVDRNPDGNAALGGVFLEGVTGSYVRSTHRPVAVIGLDDVVVVETPEAVLVMSRHRAEQARAAAAWFEEQGGT